MLIILLAVWWPNLVIRRKNTVNNVIDVISMLPYIIPGSVVGIALIMAFKPASPLILTGTMIIMVIALVIRRLPYTIRSSVAHPAADPHHGGGSQRHLAGFLQGQDLLPDHGAHDGKRHSFTGANPELGDHHHRLSNRHLPVHRAHPTDFDRWPIYTYVSRGNDGIAAALATILSLTRWSRCCSS